MDLMEKNKIYKKICHLERKKDMLSMLNQKNFQKYEEEIVKYSFMAIALFLITIIILNLVGWNISRTETLLFMMPYLIPYSTIITRRLKWAKKYVNKYKKDNEYLEHIKKIAKIKNSEVDELFNQLVAIKSKEINQHLLNDIIESKESCLKKEMSDIANKKLSKPEDKINDIIFKEEVLSLVKNENLLKLKALSKIENT